MTCIVYCLLFLKPQFLLLLTCRRFLEGPRGWRPTLPLERPPPWPGWGHFSRSLLRPDPEILKRKNCYFGRKKASTLGFDRFARDQAVKKIECPYLHLWGVVEVCESVQFGKEESHGLSDVFNLRWNLVVTFPVKHAYKTSAESGRLIIGHLQVVYIVQDVQ